MSVVPQRARQAAAGVGQAGGGRRRWPRWGLVALVGTVTAAVAGCSGLGATETSATSPTPVTVTVTAPAPGSADADPTGSSTSAASATRSAPATESPAAPTAPTTPGTRAPAPTPSTPAKVTALRPGSSGEQVRALQQRLVDLGYWVSTVNGRYGLTTSQAVMALQKVAGLSRDGVAGPKTMAALQAAVRPTARTSNGSAIEIDKARQVALVVSGGRVRWVLNTSTGSGQTYRNKEGQLRIAVTPAGNYRVDRQIRGWHTAPLGKLYSPKFFNGGIALHGSESIPGYPASHGCARLSVPAMDFIWSSGAMPIGSRVVVY